MQVVAAAVLMPVMCYVALSHARGNARCGWCFMSYLAMCQNGRKRPPCLNEWACHATLPAHASRACVRAADSGIKARVMCAVYVVHVVAYHVIARVRGQHIYRYPTHTDIQCCMLCSLLWHNSQSRFLTLQRSAAWPLYTHNSMNIGSVWLGGVGHAQGPRRAVVVHGVVLGEKGSEATPARQWQAGPPRSRHHHRHRTTTPAGC